MIFRTELNINPSSHKISYHKPLVFIGSCFSTNIGSRLQKDKFTTLINPFGTLYNPYSIANSLLASSMISINSDEILETSDGLFKHYDYHGDLFATDPKRLVESIAIKKKLVFEYIKKASHLFITLGTAYVFERISDKKIVANCHKQSSELFTRRLLSIEEIIGSIQLIQNEVFKLNQSIQIILTISPIRHLRDGMIENNRSKGRLIEACHEAVGSSKGLSYFPSYELVLDDLRDYRFYESDLIHPNALAVEYIYEKLRESHFSDESVQTRSEVLSLLKATHHRSFHNDSDQHQAFLRKTIEKIKANAKKNSIDWDQELKLLQSNLLS